MTRTMVDTPAGSICVETGLGRFDKIVEEKGRNQQIRINADGLKHPIQGWLDKTNEDLVAALDTARRQWDGRFAFRIDVVRGTGVAADTPWADLQPIQKFRRLVAIRPELELAQLVPAAAMATVGAPPESAATTPPAAPAAAAPPATHAPTPTPPAAPSGAQAERRCVACGEPVGTRPVKKVPNGYVHTDTPCLEAPFADAPATTGPVDLQVEDDAPAGAQPLHRPDGTVAGYVSGDKAEEVARAHAEANGLDPDSVIAAGKAATAQRQAAAKHCQLCDVDFDGARADHDTGERHQGKLRQADQAAELAAARQATDAQRQANIEQATRFDEAPHPVKLAPVDLPTPRGKVIEGKNWEEFNSDGSLNYGSYRMQANIAGVTWAQRILIDRARVVAGETGVPAQIDPGQLRSLARTLLQLSDRIQASVRDDGRYDRMDSSHARARTALATALNVYPIPFGGVDADVKADWAEQVVAWAVHIIRIAAELDA